MTNHNAPALPDGEVDALRARVAELEQALTERSIEAERFRLLVEQARDGIGIAANDGIITYANAAFKRQTGLGEQAVGNPFAVIYPPEEMARVFAMAEPELHVHGSWNGITYPRRPDGTDWIADFTVTLLRDDNGNVIGNFAIHRDITAQQSQARRLQQFESLAESALDAILITVNRRIVYANRAYRALTGYGEEVIGQGVDVAIAEDAATLTSLRTTLDANNTWFGVLHFRHKDGYAITTQSSLMHIVDSAGAHVASAAIIRDITAQQAQEERLRVFQALAENAPDGISLATPGGVITYTNPAYRAMCGYTEAMDGVRIADLVVPEAREQSDALRQAIASANSWSGVVQYRRRNGDTFPAQDSVFPIRAADGTIVALSAITRDISRQQQAEAERQALQQQVIDAQQAALRELSTPLVPVAAEVVVMPLVGTLDTRRVEQVMETLLDGIVQYQAEFAILDVTGVRVVDTQVAQALLRVAQAAKLLGTTIILTGISAEIAQTLVHLGADLSTIITRSNLQSGIVYARKGR